jgi:transcriptional regulator of acetoin/glycerol metabolism
MTHPYWLMFVIILAAGAAGGILNYLLGKKDNADSVAFWQSLVGGIVASFMVPLFLNMISSNLVDSIRGGSSTPGDPSRLFVFAGFCLVAAVSSKAFISTLSDRILSEAKAARKEVKQIKNEVDPITEKEAGEVAQLSALARDRVALGDNQKTVLEALKNGKFTLRTRTGLSTQTKLPKDEVIRALSELANRGLARSVKVLVGGEPKTRWFATEEGRAVED